MKMQDEKSILDYVFWGIIVFVFALGCGSVLAAEQRAVIKEATCQVVGSTGGVGGAMAGEHVATEKVYQCILLVEPVNKSQRVYVRHHGALKSPGQHTILVKLTDGTYVVK